MEGIVLCAVALYDVYFLCGIHEYHITNGDKPGHHQLTRAVYGIPDLVIIANTAPLTVAIHVVLGTFPLLLSIVQLSSWIRSRSITFHRWTGRLCLVSSLLSAIFAFGLPYYTQDVGPYTRVLIVLFVALWFVSALFVWYYARARDIPKHRAWGVRFATYTHGIPLMSRVVILLLWLGYGCPRGTYDPPKASHPDLFCGTVWLTTTVVPLAELLVVLSQPSGKRT
eukprot:Sspe_Gene.115324::Locus_102406_Transcript_1_2_Confidence_0.750_Length_906::g.115324::m.115324